MPRETEIENTMSTENTNRFVNTRNADTAMRSVRGYASTARNVSQTSEGRATPGQATYRCEKGVAQKAA